VNRGARPGDGSEVWREGTRMHSVFTNFVVFREYLKSSWKVPRVEILKNPRKAWRTVKGRLSKGNFRVHR